MNRVDELLFKLKMYIKEFNLLIYKVSKDNKNDKLINKLDMLEEFIGETLDELEDLLDGDDEILDVVITLFGGTL